MFRVLERPSFSTAQQALFPIYFSLQTALPVILALTYPGSKNPLGTQSGVAGILEESKRYCTLLPIVTIFVTGALNLFVLLPATKKIMAERYAQGKNFRSVPSCFVDLLVLVPTASSLGCPRPSADHSTEKKDGKKSYDPAPQSQEMQTLNKRFGKTHGISSLLNLTTFIATVAYGFTLASRIG